ncbi:hypothetical protein N234_32350 [Ralstonia pickettii DTP0602]|nr:hypothetical protein N234_32350 [Ralstonia pickettii DTP0602]
MSETTEIASRAAAAPLRNSAADAEARAIAVADTVARTAVEQADHAMRHWTDPTPGPVRIGSAQHLQMFCHMLQQTHNPYKPAVIDWPGWRRPLFALKVARVWAFLIRERIGIARGIDADGAAQDANFTMNGSAALGEALTPGAMIDLCLVENERRMAGYDARLLRPETVPRLARLARRFVK